MVAEQRASTEALAFERYRDVRRQMLPLRHQALPSAALTATEREMASSLAELWDVGPEAMATFRHIGALVGGARASDYDEPARALRVRLERDRRRLLLRGDHRLWVDEPAALGGFGIGGERRYNEDTLQCFRVLSMLGAAEVLTGLSEGPRPTVWEIGGGWGGVAYQVKTVCPDLTYLISGSADEMLLSAVYVSTLFQDARIRVFDPMRPDDFWVDWHAVDFAFAPESALDTLRPPSLELTLDVMALHRMSVARLERHVRRARDLQVRYFVSVHPPHDAEGEGASSVHRVLTRSYWPHPMSAHSPRGDWAQGAGGLTYFLGWRRLRT